MAKHLSKAIASSAILGRVRRSHQSVNGARAPARDRRWARVAVARLVRLEAQPGKESELTEFLAQLLRSLAPEAAGAAWFALRFGRAKFAIFVAFVENGESQASWEAQVMGALKAKVPELLAKAPVLETAEVVRAKLADWPSERSL